VAGSVPPPPQTSGLAIASLICSLIPFFLITPIVAVILGHISLSQIKHSAGSLKGSGLAIAGLVLGYLSFVPIILIIAAIAIPNLLRARVAANESSAVASVRTLYTAETSYASAHQEKGYTCQLGDLRNTGSINSELGSGTRAGYIFELIECNAENPGGPNTKFQVIAYPITKGSSGRRAFCSDETGVVRSDPSGSGQSCLENGTELR
jgi:type II secretory pathway pseudopilin PulG